jgi:hypothetical protein
MIPIVSQIITGWLKILSYGLIWFFCDGWTEGNDEDEKTYDGINEFDIVTHLHINRIILRTANLIFIILKKNVCIINFD